MTRQGDEDIVFFVCQTAGAWVLMLFLRALRLGKWCRMVSERYLLYLSVEKFWEKWGIFRLRESELFG